MVQPVRNLRSAALEASKVVFEELERLLDAAWSGEIIGIAGSFVHSSKTITYSYAGKVAGFGTIGGIECPKERFLRIARERGSGALPLCIDGRREVSQILTSEYLGRIEGHVKIVNVIPSASPSRPA